MINIHFFNVGNGDSIIVESGCSSESKYVVIDSNLIGKNGTLYNPGHEYLKSCGVKTIHTLIITHFHKDHITGMDDFMRNYSIEKILIPPILSRTNKDFEKMISKNRDVMNAIIAKTADEKVARHIESVALVLDYICNNEDRVEEAYGKENELRIPGAEDLRGKVYLPLPLIKGVLRQKLVEGKSNLIDSGDANEASIALSIECEGFRVLLAGDSTAGQWSEHWRQMKRDGVQTLDVHALKAPHHGSKYSNTEKTYEYYFGMSSNTRSLIVSANGKRHPHRELFRLIERHNLKPYCTNLSKHCVPDNVMSLEGLQDMPARTRPFLMHYERSAGVTPCQDKITLEIDEKGMRIKGSGNRPCVYGNHDSLKE